MSERLQEPERDSEPGYAAFAGGSKVGEGALADAAVAARRAQGRDAATSVLVVSRQTGEIVDLDLRGTEADVQARYAPAPPEARRGRPRLGVLGREVTLLPRHWEWLARQPGGASAALRRLTEAAVRSDAKEHAAAAKRASAHRFMTAVAAGLPGFEEAARRLLAGDGDGLRTCMSEWPSDVSDMVLTISDGG